jgi:uncharacterized protein YraI
MSFRSLAVAGAFVLGLVAPHAALAAFTTGDVNLRTGPGTGYPIITTAPAGASVKIFSCAPSWCNVAFRGWRGWMSASYLGRAAPRVYYAPVRPRAYYRPPVVVYPRTYYPRPYYYYPRPRPGPYYGFYFGYGGRWR